MNKTISILGRLLSALTASLLIIGSAAAEPPLRAARLGDIDGAVSFSPAGHPDWVRASLNRPLTTGDRLWTPQGARAEVQVGGAAMRIGPLSDVTLLRLDNRVVQLQLTQGVLRLRVRSLGPRQYFEVATPNLALTVRRPGNYRIEVDPDDDATAVLVRSGEAEVYGEGRSYRIDSRRGYRFYDTGLDDYDVLAVRRDDDFDRWSHDRDRFIERSISARYVSTDVVGYADLDAHGHWRSVSDYGYVWAPNRVPAGWSPYRDGHWAWVDPWGWTWIDDAPWGYAVSHYGRWARLDGGWVWVPGPRREPAVYAPALVAFIGGSNFSISISGGSTGAVGWFPLAPREVYTPSYAVSREYFNRVNRSNTVIAPQTITQVYNTTIVNNNTTVIVNNTAAGGAPVRYANRQVAGAVVAVPTQAFVQSQPVARARVQVEREVAVRAPVARVASVAPVTQSLQGGRETAARPPVREKRVVARTPPPAAPVAFATQAQELAAKPGRPIDEASRARMKPAPEAAAQRRINVVESAPTPAATALPPADPPPASRRAARRAETAPTESSRREAAPPPAAAAPEQAVKAEEPRAERAKEQAAKAEESRAERAKEQAAKAEESRADRAKEQAAKAEESRADRAKEQAAQAAAARSDAVKAEAAKAQAARAEEAKAEAAKSEAARAAAARAQAGKAEEAKADAAKAQADKAEAARAEAAQAQSGRDRAAKAEQARDEANKARAAKADEARAEAAKAEASRAEANKAAAAKAQSDKAEEARADAAKARAEAAAKQEAAKAQAARAEEARANAAKAAAAQKAAPPKDEAPAARNERRERRGDGPNGPAARASEAEAAGDERRRGPR
jgi:hypothetical protein